MSAPGDNPQVDCATDGFLSGRVADEDMVGIQLSTGWVDVLSTGYFTVETPQGRAYITIALAHPSARAGQ